MTPAEGQNGNSLPAAVNFPESLQRAGNGQTPPQHELWEEGVGDARPGEGGWRAGVSWQGDLVQVKDSKVERQGWLEFNSSLPKWWPEGQGH